MFFFDYDLDGRLDLLTANGHLEDEINKVQASQQYAQPPQLFWNAGGAGRPASCRCAADAYARSVPADGGARRGRRRHRRRRRSRPRADGGQGPPRLLRNDQPSGHHWLRLSLRGTRSNRDAIGSIVEVRVGAETLRRTVMPTRGYLSQSELPVTFGLGDRTQVDEVRIRWPDGSTQQLRDVAMDALTTIVQSR